MAVLGERDAGRWHRLAGRIAGTTEARLDRRVVANRVTARGGGWSLEPLGASLRRARRAARHIGAPLVLRTDVADFYPSVRPDVVVDALVGLDVSPDDAQMAGRMLEGWSSEGYPGLPIGPPGSAVLGNAVLATVDVALADCPFVRWVDDYLIGVRSERQAEQVLERLDMALDGVALRRSEAKTSVGESLGVAWLRASPCGARR